MVRYKLDEFYQDIPTAILTSFSGSKFMEMEGFTPDSTHVRVGNFFWLIGGSISCSPMPAFTLSSEVLYSINKNSMLWSLSKNKWLNGPDYMKGNIFSFGHTCAIAINKTAVLFIGLQDDYKYYFANNKAKVPNDIAIIYNFEFYSWALQDFLPFNRSVPIKHTISEYVKADTSCTVLHEKVRSRLVVLVHQIMYVVIKRRKIN